MTISADDVRRLLESEHADALLVLVAGSAEVISQAETSTPRYNGALQVVSREELVKRVGGADPSDREIAEQAAILDSTVSELGG